MTDSYSVSIRESALRKLRTFPKDDVARIWARINQLAVEPRPHGCQKLAGGEGYRIRQGDYRILYTIDDELRKVDVYNIDHRRQAYR